MNTAQLDQTERSLKAQRESFTLAKVKYHQDHLNVYKEALITCSAKFVQALWLIAVHYYELWKIDMRL